MGGAVVRAAKQTDGVTLTGAIDKPGSARLGKDAGEISSSGYLGVAVSDWIDPHLKPNTVIIDFTNPEAALVYLRAAAKKKAPIVIATTGFNLKQLTEIRRLSRHTPTLLSANTSLGVNVLVALLGRAAEMLGDDYDVEIIEAHHRFKKDAPSGTAKTLGEILKRELNLDVLIESIREGDVVGQHTVTFVGPAECLELTHRAGSREIFGSGALRAAKWVIGKSPGLYSMQDVLGISSK